MKRPSQKITPNVFRGKDRECFSLKNRYLLLDRPVLNSGFIWGPNGRLNVRTQIKNSLPKKNTVQRKENKREEKELVESSHKEKRWDVVLFYISQCLCRFIRPVLRRRHETTRPFQSDKRECVGMQRGVSRPHVILAQDSLFLFYFFFSFDVFVLLSLFFLFSSFFPVRSISTAFPFSSYNSFWKFLTSRTSEWHVTSFFCFSFSFLFFRFFGAYSLAHLYRIKKRELHTEREKS